ncbi:MAG: HEAT repeat domain-containing protein [Planctomycetes bacterium]|nr:HEAT repeat domain-containing protein [Planctomycetota bacterium]
MLTDDLAKVPEAQFQARPEKITPNAKLVEQTAMQLAKINHLNATKTDAFMTTLLENRPDLAGLPFKMGDDCRTSGEHTKHFTHAVILVRQTLERSSAQPIVNGGFTPRPQPAAVSSAFWQSHPAACDREDELRSSADKALCEHVTVARIAALMQMLADKSPELRLGLVKHLAATSHVDATKALARMAIFSAEDEVRIAAVDALKVRREKDYTDILVKGLRYPFPAVAKRSADAIARIGRTDLIPELVGVLEEADPRMPKEKKLFGGTKINVVREMVKVNHNRNCMMCHAPGNPSTVTTAALTVEVPIEGVPLPLPAEGYRQSSPDLMIRLDVTYLRQDFSVQLAVADSNPWPEMQRFDFLVRERLVTSTEAELYREKLTPKEAGVLSPYHRAALAALRDITGKDTAPTAAAWRKLLDQPAKTVEVKRYSNGKIEE